MKYLKTILCVLGLLLASPAFAVPPPCPANVTPTSTSCWSYNESSGTTAFDAVDSNDGTFQGAFTLTGNGVVFSSAGQVAQPPANSGGGYVSTASLISPSPYPVTVIIKFAGTGGGLMQFANTAQPSASQQNLVLYITSFGTIAWGGYNYGLLPIVQSLQPGFQQNGITGVAYSDGNPHTAVASLGPAGMKLYVDGVKVGSNPNTQNGGTSPGYWLAGAANTKVWPASPANISFNGTVYYSAVWQGTQLTDAQALAASGYAPPTPNNIPLCTIYGNIATLAQNLGFNYANQNITFLANPGPQLPNGMGAQIVAPGTTTVQTDAAGNLPTGFQLPQGAHVMMSIGSGATPSRQIPLTVPLQSSVELAGLVLAEVDPPQVVSQILVNGPQMQGWSVQNPAPGQIGPATITSPNSQVTTCGLACTISPSTGPVQQVNMTANVAINLCGMLDGQTFSVDTVEAGSGGNNPTFGVCAPFTLSWNNGGGTTQPAMPLTAVGNRSVWTFITEGNTVVGQQGATGGPGSGTTTFSINGTVNFNEFSGINLGGLWLLKQPPPSNVVATASCSGTCATTYTYEVTCLNDTGESTPGTAVTAVNAASLSSSNFNVISWAPNSDCFGGYNVYGRIGGSLGLLANVPVTNMTPSYTDQGAVSGGASYTFKWATVANPAVAIWDLRNAVLAAGAPTPINLYSSNSGNSTAPKAVSITTTVNHDRQLPIIGFAAGATLTPPGGFVSTVLIGGAPGVNYGLWGGTLDIAAAGATGNAVGTLSVAKPWAALNIGVLPANPATPITIVSTANRTSSSPYNTITFGDAAGVASGDLEIICVSFANGSGIVPDPKVNLIGSASTGVAQNVKVGCYYTYPSGNPAPPTENTTGSIFQTLADGTLYREVLAGLQTWTANVSQSGSGGSPQASISYPVDMIVTGCRATWVGWSCTGYPVFAFKDTTAGIVLCSSGVLDNTSTDKAITPSSYILPANDVLQFLATTAGNTCTQGNASMSIVMHQ